MAKQHEHAPEREEPEEREREERAGDDTSSEVERLRRERDELTARWQRAQADFQNLRRRTQSEIEGALRRSLLPLLESLMLVIDHLDLALSTPRTTEESKAIAHGVELTREKLLHALAQEGVVPIPESRAFDPALHEAVSAVERDDVEPGTVLATLRPGYTWRGQVLRHAHVLVSSAPSTRSISASQSEHD